jgi:WD40 repeat protein
VVRANEPEIHAHQQKRRSTGEFAFAMANRRQGIINATAVWDVKWMPGSENLFLAAHDDGTLVVYDKEKEDAAFVPDEHATASPTASADASQPRLQILKSVRSQAQKTNPVAYWKVCHQRINAIEFSPDGMHLAMVSGDGCLRIIDFHKEE